MSYAAENCVVHGGIASPSACFECQDNERQTQPSPCRTGCDTQDHATYGECLQAASISIDRTSLRP
jgi:hypothetical protein